MVVRCMRREIVTFLSLIYQSWADPAIFKSGFQFQDKKRVGSFNYMSSFKFIDHHKKGVPPPELTPGSATVNVTRTSYNKFNHQTNKVTKQI